MKKTIFIIKNYDDEKIIEEMEVKKYYDCGFYYDLEFNNGFGSILKERVIRIEERI